MTLYHGTRSALTLHAGLCLANREASAAAYGRDVHTLTLDASALTVREMAITQDMIDAQDFPADTAAEVASLVAEGVDAIAYDDMDPNGGTHRTIRLLSARALAAVSVSA